MYTIHPMPPGEKKYNNNKHNLLLLYIRLKRYNEIQLTKNKMSLNNRNIKNRPSFPFGFVNIKHRTK